MKCLVLIILCALNTTLASRYNCSARSALLILKKPTYEFSVQLLDRVAQETNEHFVFSPISTYMQMLALSEGARGNTWREIWNVTRHHRLKCFRRKWKLILNRMDAELGNNSRRKSLIVLNRLVRVKPAFVREVKRLKAMDVLPLAFNYPERAAATANKVISDATNGVIENTFTPYDFNFTVLLTADTSYYKTNWQIPFNPVYTKPEPFESSEFRGEVNMMNRIDYFHMADIGAIKARVLEIPCGSHNKVSMLFFLPYKPPPLITISDVFYDLQKIRLTSIFNTFKMQRKKLVDVKLPRFKIRSDVDNLPELLYDMGVKGMFYPDSADLRGISDYKTYVSLMTQIADIEVDEEGVRAGVLAASMVSREEGSEKFIANRTFAFMLVDRKTEVIMFAGAYSLPSMY